MNYILEIKAFYELLELNQLRTPAIVLWHALMHMANKTGWQDNFTVAIPVLTIKTGLNKQAVLKARNELKEKGLIDFKSRNNQAASYMMKSLLQYEKHGAFQTAEDTARDTAKYTANDTAEDTARDTAEDTINKHKPNKTKPNEIIESVSTDAPTPTPDPAVVSNHKTKTRHKYGEYGWVQLTDEEYERLLDQYGQQTVDYYIRYIDESAQQTGNKNKWKDWNLTIRKAIRDQWGNYGQKGRETDGHTGTSSGENEGFYGEFL